MSLSSIRARVEAATEGEWHAEEIAGENHIVAGYPFGDSIGEFDEEGDAEFAAHAKHDIPLLLKVAEAMKESIMWRGEVCPEWPEMKHGDCISRCGNRRVCAALAELEAGE